MRVAYSAVPCDNGVYCHFKTLQRHVQAHGCDMVGVSLGAESKARWQDAFAGPETVAIAPWTDDPAVAIRELSTWLKDEQISVLVSVAQQSLYESLPHVPQGVAIVSRCCTNTQFGYREATYAKEHISGFVTTTPRQREELLRYEVDPERVALIPHGISIPNVSVERTEVLSQLRVGYLGRLEDWTKGVLHLPKIASEVARMGGEASWHIAGSGPAENQLRRKAKALPPSVGFEFLGQLRYEEVSEFLQSLDVLVVPSRVEGFGIVLIEAMRDGAVSVVSRIRGVTDWVVEDGESGVLVPIDDVTRFAQAIVELSRDREKLGEMASNAKNRVRHLFNADQMARDYVGLFRRVYSDQMKRRVPVPIEAFQPSPVYRKTWRRFVPSAAKLFVRRMRERYLRSGSGT